MSNCEDCADMVMDLSATKKENMHLSEQLDKCKKILQDLLEVAIDRDLFEGDEMFNMMLALADFKGMPLEAMELGRPDGCDFDCDNCEVEH